MSLSSSNNSDIYRVLVISSDGKILLQDRLTGLKSTKTILEMYRTKIRKKAPILQELMELLKGNFHFSFFISKLHFGELFIVKINASSNDIDRIHGMHWVNLEKIISICLERDVVDIFSTAVKYIKPIIPDIVKKCEALILKKFELIKKNDRVFYSKKYPFSFNKNSLYLFKELAILKKIPLFRVCLHTSNNEITHEMLMIHTYPQCTKPHRTSVSKNKNKTVSYHAIDGEAVVYLYDKNGNVTDEIAISSYDDNQPYLCRLNAEIFRSMKSSTNYFMFLETSSGPFNDSDTVWFDLNSSDKCITQ